MDPGFSIDLKSRKAWTLKGKEAAVTAALTKVLSHLMIDVISSVGFVSLNTQSTTKNKKDSRWEEKKNVG
jgi:hypothetical protein